MALVGKYGPIFILIFFAQLSFLFGRHASGSPDFFVRVTVQIREMHYPVVLQLTAKNSERAVPIW
jgi:hypothetical protein